MKKKNYFVIAYVLFVIVTEMSIYKILEPKKLGEVYSPLYETLSYQMKTIKSNMDEITASNDKWKWAKLKEINSNDKQLGVTYNMLVSDIRECYLLSDDFENKTNGSTKMLDFKDKTHINKKDLLELNKNSNCLSNFNKYNSMALSDNQQLSEKIRKQIGIIISYESKSSNDEDFGVLLYNQTIAMSKIASLSGWLKVEYNSKKGE